jgi:NADH dehydrogenase
MNWCALNWTIFRPSPLYGKGFGFFNRLAQCVLLALKRPEAVGQIYETGGPEHLTHSQMLCIWLFLC